MAVTKEPSRYQNTILYDLQKSWEDLREIVFRYWDFEGSNAAILYINEAMSWEVVRNLKRMGSLLKEIGDICSRANADEEIMANIKRVDDVLKKVNSEISEC